MLQFTENILLRSNSTPRPDVRHTYLLEVSSASSHTLLRISAEVIAIQCVGLYYHIVIH
jgi:hypothetical protein